MRELLIATRNKHKLPELIAGLRGIPFTCISLNETDLPADIVVEEPGSTYEAHAAIKAFTYGKRSGRLTLADDSGLEVDALGGWPGVYSATHMQGSDTERLVSLLEKMKEVPEGSRGAQYRSVIAAYDPQSDKIRFAEGVTRGRILMQPEGDNMFGYNRIFFSDDLQESFGTAPFERQAPVTHRTRAILKMRDILLNEFI